MADTFAGHSPPFFLRKIDRGTRWLSALQTGIAKDVEEFFNDSQGRVSLWRVANDFELICVALAMNEGRDSLFETLDLLPIFETDLKTCSIDIQFNLGQSDCPPAARLHAEAIIANTSDALVLIQFLLNQKRNTARCSKGAMKLAVASQQEAGCFVANTNSTSCNCGEKRDP